MTTENPKITLTPLVNRFAAKRNYILYPIESIDVMGVLAKSNTGYLVSPPPRGPRPPVGTRFDAVGIIARKGNCTIDFDSVTQIIGVEGPDPREVIATLFDVESIIQRDLKLNIEENIRFYEIMSNYQVETGNNPLKVLGNIRQPKEMYDSISGILNEEITNQSIHISSRSDTIETPNWFDISIRPLPNRSSKTYDVMIIFRRSKKGEVAEFLKSIENKISNIIATIEKTGIGK